MKPTIRLMLVVASLAVMPALVFAGPAAAAKGGNKADVQLCKQRGSTGFHDLGKCVSRGGKGAPSPGPSPILELNPSTYPCPSAPSPAATCWGTIAGSGLTPNSPWYVFEVTGVITSGQTDSTGSVTTTQLNLQCTIPPSQYDVFAQADSPAGQMGHIYAEVESPC